LGGKDVHFTLDFAQAEVHEAIGKMGSASGGDSGASSGAFGDGLQRVLALEVYDKFPNILLSTVEYKNTGTSEIVIEKGVISAAVNARLGDAKAHPWEMWSFHGASYNWGKTM